MPKFGRMFAKGEKSEPDDAAEETQPPPLEEGAPLLDKTLPEMQKSHLDESTHSVN